VFLSIETPENPTPIGRLALLDPSTTEGYDFERFQDFVGERIDLCRASPTRFRKCRSVPTAPTS
jgi:hypothetical protein